MPISRFPIVGLLLCALMSVGASNVGAQEYPTRPIRYIVPSSIGSAVDTIGRIVASGLTEALGQQVFVDNRAGAGGNIGAAVGAAAPADGYTVIQVNNNHTTNVTLYKSLNYDLMRDFAPVTKLAFSPYVLVVHPSLPVKSIRDLIKLAKSQPGALTYASAGVGSGTFMAAELFRSQAHLDMLHVPYVGGGPAITAVVTGEALLYAAPLATALPQIRAGKLRPIGVTTVKRIPLLPDCPTIAETVPGYEFNAWAGLLVPAKTPGRIIERIRRATVEALGRPNVSKRLSELGYHVFSDHEGSALTSFMKSEVQKMAKLIRENKIPSR